MDPIKRCKHGVYDPHGTGVYCGICNPLLHELVSQAPKFNRRGAMTLTETGKLPKCPDCGSILTVSGGGVCKHCGKEYEIQAPQNLRANNTQPGICPDCGSGVHYTTDKARVWICADCGKDYDAPRTVKE